MPEPSDAEVVGIHRAAAASKYFNDLAQRTCPFCEKHIDSADQVGRCVYLNPCGHRLGQADAAALMRVWSEPR